MAFADRTLDPLHELGWDGAFAVLVAHASHDNRAKARPRRRGFLGCRVWAQPAAGITDSVAAHLSRLQEARMTAAERERYVRWWLERSGLTARQVRAIATGIWSDRVIDAQAGEKAA